MLLDYFHPADLLITTTLLLTTNSKLGFECHHRKVLNCIPFSPAKVPCEFKIKYEKAHNPDLTCYKLWKCFAPTENKLLNYS